MSSSSATSGMKWMRKGTKSCQECRRRKIKCTYAADNSTTCNECAGNGRVCTRQGIVPATKRAAGVDKAPGVKVRVARLESLVERLSKVPSDQIIKLSPDTPSETQPELSTSLPDTKRMTDYLEQHATARPPLFALFNNEVVRTNEDLAIPSSVSYTIDFGVRQLSDREKLLSTISKETGIMEILRIAPNWWQAWQVFYPGMKEVAVNQSLQNFVTLNLAQSSPVLVASGLLCIAISLQNIRPGIDDQNLQLSTSVTELMNRITAAVDQVVLGNDNYVSCFEGVVVTLMRGKLHAENNQLRKAWLEIRRSILLAQKIGLTQLQSETTSVLATQCQQFVERLFETDQFLSMFLGMPYALDGRLDDAHAGNILLSNADVDGKMRALRRITAIAAGSINDRNSGPEESAFSNTAKIQNFLQTGVESMPTEWWDISTHTTHIDNPVSAHEHLSAQFWFYQTECFLHLPYMLRAASDKNFEYNRQICLNASRQLVEVWFTTRQNPMVSIYTCKLDDFQAVISTIILLVGLLQYSSEDLETERSTIDDDLKLIEVVKNIFRSAAPQQGGSIAKKGLHVIETLGSFIQSDGIESATNLDFGKPRKATLFVPYFGAIEIESQPLYRQKETLSRSENNQEEPKATSNGSYDWLSAGGMTGDSFDMFPSESSFDSQEPVYGSYSKDPYYAISTSQQFTGNDSNYHSFADAPDTFSTPSEASPPSMDVMALNSKGFEPQSNDFNTLPTGLTLDWDKIMAEPDLNQDWDAALFEFAPEVTVR